MSGRKAARGRAALPLLLLIAAGTLAVYGGLAQAPFVAVDDAGYVPENPGVRFGLGAQALRWAFTTFDQANWHPVTWLSHQLDVSLFGLRPGPHHLVNVALHLANGLLLLGAVRALTGRLWASAGVAALFLFHPLRVESVAWVAERKDLLCALFSLLTLSAYLRWLRRPSPARFAGAVALYALALLAKPMAVTLPALLLLLDFWPLGRVGAAPPSRRGRWTGTLAEKAPFLLLALASAALTLIAQARGGTVQSLEAIPFAQRAANAAISVVRYLVQGLWPAGLAVYYPHPGAAVSWAGAAAAALGVAGASVAALAAARRLPCLTTGWFWYLVMLVPVIGLVQVGGQSMADRYTYLPLVGVSLALCWGVPQALGGARRVAAAAAAAALAVLALAAAARFQVGHYRDNEELLLSAAAATQGNYFAHSNLGALYVKAGNLDAAARHYELALAARPEGAIENYNCADLLVRLHRAADAVPYLRRSLAADPGHPGANYHLGMILARQGDAAGARLHLQRAQRALPDNPMIRLTLEQLERSPR